MPESNYSIAQRKYAGDIKDRKRTALEQFFFLLGFFGDELFVFGFLFGRFFFGLFVFEWAEGFAVFFNQDFDTTGDRNGNNRAWNAKHIDTNSDGGENGEGRELKAFALNLRRNDVGFDLEINNRVDNEGETGAPNVEGEQKSDKCAADEGAEHWNEAKDAGDEAEWQGEARIKTEEERQDKDHCCGAAGVNEADHESIGNVFGNDFRHAIKDMVGVLGLRVAFEVIPELLDNSRTFCEHKEGENEDEDKCRDEAGEGADARGEVGAEILHDRRGNVLDVVYDVGLEMLDADGFAKIVEPSEAIRNGFDGFW